MRALSLSRSAPIVIPFAALLLSCLMGVLVYQIMESQYQIHPFWGETEHYQRLNLNFLHIVKNDGKWSGLRQVFLYNNCHFLQFFLLVLFAPELLASPHAHLFIALPVFFIFIGLFGWTVYRRTTHVGYAVACMVFFVSLSGIINEDFGLGTAFIDWQSMLLVSSAAMCLINALTFPNRWWPVVFSALLSLGILARMGIAPFAAVICGPIFLLFLISEYQKRKKIVTVAIPVAIFLAFMLFTGAIVWPKIEFLLGYYLSPNASVWNHPLLTAANIYRNHVVGFVGKPAILTCFSLFIYWMAQTLWVMKQKQTQLLTKSNLAILWWAVGFFSFLLSVGFVSDMPKEVMYGVPPLILGACAPWIVPRVHGRPQLHVLAVILAMVALIHLSYNTVQIWERVTHANLYSSLRRQSQLEIAKKLSLLPEKTLWQSYVYPDWGGGVRSMSFYYFGRYRPGAGADFFANHKNYWDGFNPGLSLEEVQEKTYARALQCVDAALILKDPKEKPRHFKHDHIMMEDYSYAIASYIAKRVQSDPNWSYYDEVSGAPFTTSPLAIYINGKKSGTECFERAIRNLKPDGHGNEHVFSEWVKNIKKRVNAS